MCELHPVPEYSSNNFFPRVTPGNRLRIMSNVVWGGIKKVAKKPANLKLKAVWKGVWEFIPVVSMQEAQTHPGHVVSSSQNTHIYTHTMEHFIFSNQCVCFWTLGKAGKPGVIPRALTAMSLLC